MSGTIPIAGTLVPAGTLPIARDTDILGGMRVVADVATRNAILASEKRVGMLVCCQTDAVANTVYQLQSTGPDVWVVFPVGGGAAGWDPTKVRYFLLDYDGGNDANLGYVDATPGSDVSASLPIAIKTFEHLKTIVPTNGNGLQAVILVKPRAGGATYRNIANTADDVLNNLGIVPGSYKYIAVRATNFFTNTADDYHDAGAIIGNTGPNGDGSYTVDAGPTSTVFSVVGAAFPAELAAGTILGMRIHWITGANAGTTTYRFVKANTATAITLSVSQAGIVAGDTFKLEVSGVRVGSNQDIAGVSSNPGSNSYLVGIAVTATTSGAFSLTGSWCSFCSAVTATANTTTQVQDNFVTLMLDSYNDEAGTSRNTGLAHRALGRFDANRVVQLQAAPVALLGGLTTMDLVDSYTLGGSGALLMSGVFTNRSGRGQSTIAAGSILGSSASASPARVITNGLQIRNGAVGVRYIDVSGAGGGGGIDIQGHSQVAMDGVTGSGNYAGARFAASSYGSTLVAGVTSANTVTGTNGDLALVGTTPSPDFAGALYVQGNAWVDLTQTNLVDAAGNQAIGTAGVFASQGVLMTNVSGGTVAAFKVIRVLADNTFTTAQADTSAHATNVIGITQNSSTDGGSAPLAMVITQGPTVVTDDAASPAVPSMCYLSEATAGNTKAAPPAVAGTNQKLRLGYNLHAFGGNRIKMVLNTEKLPILSDGVSP